MKRVLLERGVRIHESTEALSLEDHTVHTHLGSVTAGQIIFCIDKPTQALTHFADNVFHAQTFLAISEPLGTADIARLFPSGARLQCWDSDLVYTYLPADGR